MSREDDLIELIIERVRDKIADIDNKGRNPSSWLRDLEELCNELDAVRDVRETAQVLEMLRR